MLEVSSHSRSTREGRPMKSLRDEMEIVNASELVGTYRGAAPGHLTDLDQPPTRGHLDAAARAGGDDLVGARG